MGRFAICFFFLFVIQGPYATANDAAFVHAQRGYREDPYNHSKLVEYVNLIFRKDIEFQVRFLDEMLTPFATRDLQTWEIERLSAVGLHFRPQPFKWTLHVHDLRWIEPLLIYLFRNLETPQPEEFHDVWNHKWAMIHLENKAIRLHPTAKPRDDDRRNFTPRIYAKWDFRKAGDRERIFHFAQLDEMIRFIHDLNQKLNGSASCQANLSH